MTVEQEQPTADSDAAFTQSFDSTRGTEPKPEVKQEEPVEAKEPEPETPAATPEVKAEEPDPLRDMKAELESVKARLASVDKIPDRLRNIEGHIGGLTSQLKTAMATAKAVEKAGGEAPTQAQIQKAVVDPERMKALKEDFPDFVDAIEALQGQVAAIKAAPHGDDLEARMGQRLKEAQATAKAEAETLSATKAAEARQLAMLDLKHDGWEETINTPEFGAWFQKQAPDIQALAKSPKARDAIRMLDAFTGDQAKAKEEQHKKDQNAQRLARAAPPKGVQAPAAKTINDDEAFESSFKRTRG